MNQLAIHAVGGVIGKGDVLMESVPRNDELIIESKVQPRDIGQVKPGAEADVRVMVGKARANPDLTGKVSLISADLTHTRAAAGMPARAYYKVLVSLPKEEVARPGHLKLISGMQAGSVYSDLFAYAARISGQAT